MKTKITICLLLTIAAFNVFSDEESPLTRYASSDYWKGIYGISLATSPENADIAIEYLRSFFLNAAKVRGDFKFERSLVKGEETQKQNQTDQVSALWAMARLNSIRGTEPVRRQVMLGLDILLRGRRPHASGRLVIAFPEQATLKTASVAYFCLALCEFLDAAGDQMPDVMKQQYAQILDDHIQFLEAQYLKEGGWSQEYDFDNQFSVPSGSIAGDAAVLLAYCRLAKLPGHENLKERLTAELKRQIADFVVPGLAKREAFANLRTYAHAGGIAIMDAYLGNDWQECRQDAAQALLSMGWAIYYSDLQSTSEQHITRTAEALLPFMKRLQADNAPQATDVRNAIIHLLDNALQRQLGGPQWTDAATEFPEELIGGVLSKRDADLVRITDATYLLRALLDF